MEMIIFVSTVTFILGIITVYLFNRQKKIIKNFKIGDKIILDGLEGEILEKTSDYNFTVKIEVSGMRLTKK
jgi:hypothetical protein